jgi:ParB family chromosome partitioning protein
MPDPGFDTLRSFGEVKGKRQPLPAKQAKALAKLEREADALRELDDLTDEQVDRLDALDAEIAALSEAALVFGDRQKARAGVIVSVGDRGRLAVLRSLIRPADMKAAKLGTGDEAGSSEAKQPAAPCFSAVLAGDLTAHRTAALRAVLADRPEIALAAAVHALAQTVFDIGGDDSGLGAVPPRRRHRGEPRRQGNRRAARCMGGAPARG